MNRPGRIAAVVLAAATSAAAGPPHPWQQSGGLRPWPIAGDARTGQWVVSGNDRAVACLGTALEMRHRQWPRLLRRPIPWRSIQRRPHRPKGERSIHTDWTAAVNLGSVSIAPGAPEKVEVVSKDWSHAALRYTARGGGRLRVWMSRLTPAVLFHSGAESLRLFAGRDCAMPQHAAFEAGGKVRVVRTDQLERAMPQMPAGSWLLLWYGSALRSSRFCPYVVYPYTADVPLLLVFGKPPGKVTCGDGLVFASELAGSVGYVAMLPLFGDDYPAAGPFDDGAAREPLRIAHFVHPGRFRKTAHPGTFTTGAWSRRLPDDVVRQCRFWAGHLREFPVSARETYAYAAAADTVSVTEEIEFLRIADAGTPLAPLPPMLALACEQGLGVGFSGPVVHTAVCTAHGPAAGIEGVRKYTWRLTGLGRCVLPAPEPKPVSAAPKELTDELVQEVEKVLDAGVLAPWYPVIDDNGAGYMGYYDRGYAGHFLFANPAETIYHLAEAYPFLRPDLQPRVLKYVRDLRAKHPPEKLDFLLLGQGPPRERYRPTPPQILQRLNDNFRSRNFYVASRLVPEMNLYHLARYYEMTGDRNELKARWKDILAVLAPYLESLDWGTMGFFRRPVGYHQRAGLGGVIDVNRFFAALVGAVRLARLAGDAEAEPMLWGLLARAAVLRFAMGKYTAYLYRHGLLRAPDEKDWMMSLLAGSWKGYLTTCDWRGSLDDVTEVWQMDQFGTYIHESRTPIGFAPGLLGFLNPTPELGRFFRAHLADETRSLLRRVNEVMPAWWCVYCPCVQTAESNIQPPEDAYQLFLLSAWVLDETPERLAWIRDVPWLARGDLFYINKLAETIRACRRGRPKP